MLEQSASKGQTLPKVRAMYLYLRSPLPLGWQLCGRKKQEVLLCLHLVIIGSFSSMLVPCDQINQRGHSKSFWICKRRSWNPVYDVRFKLDCLSHLHIDQKYDDMGMPFMGQDQLPLALASSLRFTLRLGLQYELGPLLLLSSKSWRSLRLENAT